MKLIRTLHRPEGIPSDLPDRVRRTTTPDPDALIPCVWEYKLPSGKVGTCGVPAVWELVYSTDMKQPFGAPGNVNLHTYRCDYHHQGEQ